MSPIFSYGRCCCCCRYASLASSPSSPRFPLQQLLLLRISPLSSTRRPSVAIAAAGPLAARIRVTLELVVDQGLRFPEQRSNHGAGGGDHGSCPEAAHVRRRVRFLRLSHFFVMDSLVIQGWTAWDSGAIVYRSVRNGVIKSLAVIMTEASIQTSLLPVYGFWSWELKVPISYVEIICFLEMAEFRKARRLRNTYETEHSCWMQSSFLQLIVLIV
jgi:hypothetical protein